MNQEVIKWPDGAKCAVMISFDPDGETVFKGTPEGADWPWPRSVSIGRYGPVRGIPRLLDMLAGHGITATFFVPALTAVRHPGEFKEIAAAGHELGCHGYNHELFSTLTLEEQKDVILRSQAVFSELAGKTAVGFRTPSGDFTRDTPRLLDDLGFIYSSSMRGDDRPYRTVIDGKASDLIEIPAKWELDDYPQFGYNFFPPSPRSQDRIESHRSALDNWIREFEGYYHYGLCYVIMFHPLLSGQPGRVKMIETLIEHIKTFPGVWFATGSEIAQWWRENY